MPARRRIVVAGGGLAGSMMALTLVTLPCMEDTDIILVERRADPQAGYIAPSAANPESQ